MYEGNIIRRRVGAGSKSDHEAVCLDTGTEVFKITRVGGNPFSDPELDRLVGSRIRCEGTLLKGNQLRVSSIEEVENASCRFV